MFEWEDKIHEEYAEYKEKNCRCHVIEEDCECMTLDEFERNKLKEIARSFDGMDEQDYREMYA